MNSQKQLIRSAIEVFSLKKLSTTCKPSKCKPLIVNSLTPVICQPVGLQACQPGGLQTIEGKAQVFSQLVNGGLQMVDRPNPLKTAFKLPARQFLNESDNKNLSTSMKTENYPHYYQRGYRYIKRLSDTVTMEYDALKGAIVERSEHGSKSLLDYRLSGAIEIDEDKYNEGLTKR